jgi:response regulator RpfG family c-di-GMP phosphodiesterase
MKNRAILIIDPDSAPDASLDDPRFQRAHSGKDAHEVLADLERPLSAIFVNPKVASPNGIHVIRFAHQYRPAVPIFMIHDGPVAPFNAQELAYLGVRQALRKPVSADELLRLATPLKIADESALADEGDTGLPSDEDRDYFSIRAEEFLSGNSSYFDLFVRLPSGRYVKVLNAGDGFSSERMIAYLKKGLTRFYVRREAQERYLAYCDELASRLLKDPSVDLEAKVSQTLRHGEETMSFLRGLGFKEVHLQHGVRFVEQVHEIVNRLDLQRNAIFKTFLDNLAAMEHGAGTAVIASMVASGLKINAGARTIGIASLFHDIGLNEMPPELQDEDEARMNPEQVALFRTHPEVGARILRTVDDMDAAAVSAVAFHHQRLGKQGFPDLAKTGRVNHAAEVVGISDEFARIIQRAKLNPRLHPFNEMERTVFDGFSIPVVSAFRNFFFLTLL